MQESEVILAPGLEYSIRSAHVSQLHVLMSPSPSSLMMSMFAQETENMGAEAETWTFSTRCIQMSKSPQKAFMFSFLLGYNSSWHDGGGKFCVFVSWLFFL